MKADELIETLQSCPQSVAAWVCGLSPRSFRDRHAPRNEDGTYNVRSVVKHFLNAAQDEVLATAQDLDSDELARWRLAKARIAEVELAERLGQLESVAVVQTHVGRVLDVLKAWAERVCRDDPRLLRTYLKAVDDALRQAESLVRPAESEVSLVVKPDAGEPFTIRLGHYDAPVELPPDNSIEPRLCPKCESSEMSASWAVAADGTEAPIWVCRRMNCWHRVPRLTGE